MLQRLNILTSQRANRLLLLGLVGACLAASVGLALRALLEVLAQSRRSGETLQKTIIHDTL